MTKADLANTMNQNENRIAFFVYGYVGLVIGILALLFGYAFYGKQTRAAAFHRDGVTVAATYTGARTVKVSRKYPQPPTYRYYGQVQFMADGRQVKAEAPISPEVHKAVRPGDRVEIRYLPGDPQTVQIDPAFERGETTLIWIILLFAITCLCYWLMRKWRANRAID